MSLLRLSVCLLVTAAFACDEACIRDCLAEEEPSAECFAQCSCSSSQRSRPFGHKFETESGAKYEIRALEYTEYDWVEKHYGCDVTCATSCYTISAGQELVECFGLCGCEELLRPLNEKAVQSTVLTQALSASGVLQSATCAHSCAEGCREDPEDSFSKCFSACSRKLCAIPATLPVDNTLLPHPLVYLLVCVGLVGVYLYLQPGKHMTYKSL